MRGDVRGGNDELTASDNDLGNTLTGDFRYVGADGGRIRVARVRPEGGAKIAAAEADFFPGTDRDVLAATIATYQNLGCWTPHVEITPAAYEVTLDVFEHVGRLSKRHPYAAVCAPPPGDA